MFIPRPSWVQECKSTEDGRRLTFPEDKAFLSQTI